MGKSTNKVVATREVLSTTDYDQFKTMQGNREVDAKHVKQLQKLMLENGNLTYEFPIIVNKAGFVVDGQHRLEALKQLGWEVGYVVEETANITTVRAINRGNHNWSWRDIAQSYANLGNENYQWFLRFVDLYGLRFSPALRIAAKRTSGKDRASGLFKAGDFEIGDKSKAHDIAKMVTELQEISELSSGDFSYALINIVENPQYNHARMVQKMKALGDTLPERAKRTVYMRELEDIYNHAYPEDSRVRLF